MKKMVMFAALAAAGRCAVRDGEAPGDTMTRELTFDVRAESLDDAKRTVELSFSSEEPYARWWGTEILDHGKSAIRLGRLNGGAALLMDHDTRDQVGVVEKAWITGRKGHAIVRFGKSARAEEIFQDVKDGIRKLVSVGYRIHKLVLEKQQDEESTYRATDWEPYEISIVSVPADTTVGVGREGAPPPFDPRSLVKEEEDDMNMTRNAAGAVAAPAIAAAAGAAAPAPAAEVRHAAPAAAAVDNGQLLAAERQRVASIRDMGQRLNCVELARAAEDAGHTLDQFIADYRARAGAASQITVAETPAIGMSERELNRYSLVRLLAATAMPDNAEARRAAAFELECSEAAQQRGHQGKAGTFRVPFDVLAQSRDLTVGTATAGGNLVATDLRSGSFIELLSNAMSVMQMGATMLTDLNGNVAIPRQTSGASIFWVAEGGTVTESNLAFDQVALTPKTAGTFVDMSRQLLLQSSISVEEFVRRDLALRMALGLDLAALNGSGSSNQPRGVLNTAGIGSVPGGTNGAAPTWPHIVGLESKVSIANADVGTMGYLTNSAVRGKLKTTQKFDGTNGVPVWGDGNEPLNGYPARVSNQVPSNLTKGTASGVCSAILFGNWADVLIGMWGGLDILPNPYILSGTGSVRIEVYQTCDVQVRHPESFAAMVDALTA